MPLVKDEICEGIGAIASKAVEAQSIAAGWTMQDVVAASNGKGPVNDGILKLGDIATSLDTFLKKLEESKNPYVWDDNQDDITKAYTEFCQKQQELLTTLDSKANSLKLLPKLFAPAINQPLLSIEDGTHDLCEKLKTLCPQRTSQLGEARTAWDVVMTKALQTWPGRKPETY